MSTNYDIDDDFSSTDEDMLLAGSDGYLSGGGGLGGDVFWNAKANSERTVYFVTDPWTKDIDHGWWIWREVYAEQGLAGGIMLPPGLAGFPVRDQEVVPNPNGEGNLRRDIAPGSEKADQLLALVTPYMPRNETRRTSPYRPVSDKVGANVVELNDQGYLNHKVLVFSAARYRKLRAEIDSKADMVEPGTFSLIGHPWLLSISGPGNAEIIRLKPLRDQPPIELPEPIDIPEKLREKRQRIFEIVRTTAKVDTTRYADEDAAVPDAPAQADIPATPDEPAAPAETTREELYASMTDSRLKTLLTKAGVPVPPKTGRAALIELAVANNI